MARAVWKVSGIAVQLKYGLFLLEMKIKIKVNAMHCIVLFDRPSHFIKHFFLNLSFSRQYVGGHLSHYIYRSNS